MADKSITDFNSITSAQLALTDVLHVGDVSTPEDKKITVAELDSRYPDTVYVHPNHSGEVTSAGDGAQIMSSTYISNKSEVTAAVGDSVPIVDLTDGTLKKVTVQTIVDLGGGTPPAWTTFTPVINDAGTFTFTSANARYFIDGKLMFIHFDITQTNAGSGTDDVTIDPPGGVTVLDSAAAGYMIGLDIANNNVWKTFGVHAINSTNKFKLTNTDTSLFMRGGNFIGNNGNGWAVNLTIAIA